MTLSCSEYFERYFFCFSFTLNITGKNRISPWGWQDYMPFADGSSTVAKIAADLRPSTDGSIVRTALVASDG